MIMVRVTGRILRRAIPSVEGGAQGLYLRTTGIEVSLMAFAGVGGTKPL